MRRIIYNAHATLNNRIAHTDGTFWEPFPWGDTEQALTNTIYAETDTWVMSRPMYQAIVPWWNIVADGVVPDDVPEIGESDRQFASIFASASKIAISRTMGSPSATVISGDVATQLQQLKDVPGKNIVLTVGPATLEPLLATPGLIDELLLIIHPAIISDGPRLFDGSDLALRLVEATPFPDGAIVTHYEVLT